MEHTHNSVHNSTIYTRVPYEYTVDDRLLIDASQSKIHSQSSMLSERIHLVIVLLLCYYYHDPIDFCVFRLYIFFAVFAVALYGLFRFIRTISSIRCFRYAYSLFNFNFQVQYPGYSSHSISSQLRNRNSLKSRSN